MSVEIQLVAPSSRLEGTNARKIQRRRFRHAIGAAAVAAVAAASTVRFGLRR